MKKTVLYVHGKGGNAGESKHYESLFPDSDVIGLNYKSQTPWEAKEEFPMLFDLHCANSESVILVANSIGAYFSMNSLAHKNISQALFISPVADMEKLISDMMMWAGVTENELKEKQNIETDLGETLSWEYFCYVRKNPVDWSIPTCILYGENDNLISHKTMAEFADKIHAPLTVMKNGEHWFHTEEQMEFLEKWVVKSSKNE